jgi:phage terminase large subunit-like protein
MSIPVTFSTEEQHELEQLLSVVDESTLLQSFTPNPGGQYEFFQDTDHHEIIFAGGNGSGKSFCGMVNGAWHTVGEEDTEGNLTGKTIHPYKDLRIPTTGVEGWMSSYSQDVQRDNLEPIFHRIMDPYVLGSPEYKDGIMQRVMFKGIDSRYPSWWNCKWITQGVNAYKGAKKNWVWMDEPHPRAIYNEAKQRLTRSGGYMWTTLTPIVDSETPLLARDVLWMHKDLVEPWERNPADLPQLCIYYVDMDENERHLDIEFIHDMMKGMPELEQKIRKSGLFLVFTGKTPFNRQMVLDIRNYLLDHITEATPEYGDLVYDNAEPDGSKVKFINNEEMDYFPEHPEGTWSVKIWERPVPTKELQVSPGYLISCDVAEGKIGGDYINAYVFRRDTRRVVAGLHGHLTEDVLAKQLWLLGHYYHDGGRQHKPATLAIEVKPGSFGSTCMTYLIRGYKEFNIPKYPLGKIFHRPTVPDLKRGVRTMSAPGWDTNVATRPYVIAGMRRGLVGAFETIQKNQICSLPDLGCVNEALGFVQNKNGKFEGHPDDRIISFGIGHQVMDLLDQGQGYVIEEDKPEEPDSLWKAGRDVNGMSAPMLNQAFIKKILRDPESFKTLEY